MNNSKMVFEMLNIIIDTDLGYDCDDGGALIIANKLHKKNKINVLAITHCVNSIEGAMAIKKINDYYGNSDIPIGVSDNYAFDVNNLYEEIFMNFKHHDDFIGYAEKPSFYKLLRSSFDDLSYCKENFPISYLQIVESLSEVEDNSAILVCIGQLNTFANLIKYNHTLLKKKLKKAVVMCGNFYQENDYFDDGETFWPGEFNVIMDLNSSKTVINHSEIPIDFIDYNQGVDILTGEGLIGQEDNPIYKMYKIHGKGKECSSWDPIAVLYATELYNDNFEVSPTGRVMVDNKGKTSFTIGEGVHRLVSIKDNMKQNIKNIINNFFKND